MPLICEKRVLELLSSVRPLPAKSDISLVDRLAQSRERWQQFGVGQGDLVLLSLPGTADQLVEFFGAVLSKATPALLPPNLPASRMQRIFESFKPKAIVANKNYKSCHPTVSQFERGTAVCIFDENGGDRTDDVMIFTSGTSGHLSACSFSIEKLLLNARLHTESIGRAKSETLYLNLPVYYSFALVAQVMAAYLHGSRLVIGNSPFNVRDFANKVSNFGVTGASLTPILAKRLLVSDLLPSLGLSFLTIGGDKIVAGDVQVLLRNISDTELYITYGLTEAGPRVSTLAAHNATEHQLGSVGTPFPGVITSISDSDPRSVGELILTSPTTADAMYKDGAISHDKLQPNGELRTGDLFRIEDDYLFFAGRVSDFIIQQGEKVNLRSVRQLMTEHHDVAGTQTAVQGNGVSRSYILTVRLHPNATASKSDLERHLTSVLRRCEYPIDIRIESLSAETPEVLKI